MQGLVEVVPSRRLRFSTAAGTSATRNLIVNNLSINELELHLCIREPHLPFSIVFQNDAAPERRDDGRSTVRIAPKKSLPLRVALDRSSLPADGRPTAGFFVVLLELCEPLLLDLIVASDDLSEEAIRQLSDARRPAVAAEMLAEVQAMASLSMAALSKLPPSSPQPEAAGTAPVAEATTSPAPATEAASPSSFSALVLKEGDREELGRRADGRRSRLVETEACNDDSDWGRRAHGGDPVGDSSAMRRAPVRPARRQVGDDGSDTSPEPPSSSDESDVAAAAAAAHRRQPFRAGQASNGTMQLRSGDGRRSCAPVGRCDSDEDRPPTPTPAEFASELAATANMQHNIATESLRADPCAGLASTGRPPPAPVQLPRGQQASSESSQGIVRGRSGGDRGAGGSGGSGPLLRSAGAAVLGLSTASSNGNAERRSTAMSEPPPSERLFFLDGVGWCDAYGRMASTGGGSTASGQRSSAAAIGGSGKLAEATTRSWPSSTAMGNGAATAGAKVLPARTGLSASDALLGAGQRARSKPPRLAGAGGGGAGGGAGRQHGASGRLQPCGAGRALSAQERARNWDALEGI